MNPPPCARGCGFFGNAATQNLCSKCYRDHLKEEGEEAEASNNIVLALSVPSTNNQTSIPNSSSSSTMIKNRCKCCNKKIGMMGFSCRCGGTFCSIHRYPEEHACKFDFKTAGRILLAEENPLCKADKLDSRV